MLREKKKQDSKLYIQYESREGTKMLSTIFTER